MESPSDWSAIPKDILNTIALLLDSPPFSLLFLRAVCSSWRSAIPLISLSPTLFPLTLPRPPDNDDVVGNQKNITIRRATVILLTSVSSSTSLLKLLQSRTKPNTFYVLDPLSDLRNRHFPYGYPPYKSLNLLDYRITVITHCYHVNPIEKRDSHYLLFKVQVIVSPSDDMITVFFLYFNGMLKLCRFRSKDFQSTTRTCWVWVRVRVRVPLIGSKKNNNKVKIDWYNRDEYHVFIDMIYFKNHCYALSNKGSLLKFDSDFSNNNPVEITNCLGYPHFHFQFIIPCLVPYCDDIFLVVRGRSVESPKLISDVVGDDEEGEEDEFTQLVSARVFKLNWRKGAWVYLINGDDKLAFHLGQSDLSFVISVRDVLGCQGNCVYLKDDCFGDSLHNGNNVGLCALDEPLVVELNYCPEFFRHLSRGKETTLVDCQPTGST